MSDKHKSDFMPEELDNNSELLSPKDEDQGYLLRSIVKLFRCRTVGQSGQFCKETSPHCQYYTYLELNGFNASMWVS